MASLRWWTAFGSTRWWTSSKNFDGSLDVVSTWVYKWLQVIWTEKSGEASSLKRLEQWLGSTYGKAAAPAHVLNAHLEESSSQRYLGTRLCCNSGWLEHSMGGIMWEIPLCISAINHSTTYISNTKHVRNRYRHDRISDPSQHKSCGCQWVWCLGKPSGDLQVTLNGHTDRFNIRKSFLAPTDSKPCDLAMTFRRLFNFKSKHATIVIRK